MPTGTVTVIAPVGRIVYVNGNYTPNFPKRIPHTFDVEYGENVFETRTSVRRVDFRGSVVTNDLNRDCKVILRKVPS